MGRGRKGRRREDAYTRRGTPTQERRRWRGRGTRPRKDHLVRDRDRPRRHPPVDDKAAGGPDGKRTPTRAAAPIVHSRSAHTGDAGAPSPLAPPSGEVGAVTPTAEGGGGEEGARRVARPPPTQWERAARRGAAAAAAAATDAADVPTAGRSACADDARRHDGRVTAGAAMRAANAGTGRVVSGRANRRFGQGGIATDDGDGAGGRQGTHQRSGAYA